jgi:hypothetical protein
MGGGVLGICLALAAHVAAGPHPALPPATDPLVRFVPATAFTLAWTHSIEKIRWEEDYRVVAVAPDAPRLLPKRARIHGSGAGMDPPPDAVFRDGWYEYTPPDRPDEPLRLTRSAYTADFDWCARGQGCRPLGDLLPSDGDVTLLWACEMRSRASAKKPR